jgi:CDGSH-type Zn-finger protein/uncharacterized Fe-S cluster protein YjdI
MSDKIRHYADEEIDVSYEIGRCIHAAECVYGLPAVFDTARKPWVLPQAASADAIAEVVTRCPSGALHYTRRDGGASESPPEQNTIVPTTNGPLYVRARTKLRAADGSVIVEDMRMALCRCGQSRNKPFCDNSHRGSCFEDSGVVEDGGTTNETSGDLTVTATANGPLLLQGPFELRGTRERGRYQATRAELCRCGASKNKPFCDRTHVRIGFRTEPDED